MQSPDQLQRIRNEQFNAEEETKYTARLFVDKAKPLHTKLVELAEKAEEFLREKLAADLNCKPKGTKIALCLVDIQRDFVMRQYQGEESGLYVQDGENAILANQALLQAVLNMANKDKTLKDKLDILITFDAHRLPGQRPKAEIAQMQKVIDDSDNKSITAKEVIKAEENEQKPFDPAKGQFGIHCILGTPGVLVADLIETELTKLEAAGFKVRCFLKGNFPATAAGIELKAGLSRQDLADPEKVAGNVYGNTTFNDAVKNYASVNFTGVCGNICVQMAASGMKRLGQKLQEVAVRVLHPFTHYLPICGLEQDIANTKEEYRKLGVELAIADEQPANYLRGGQHLAEFDLLQQRNQEEVSIIKAGIEKRGFWKVLKENIKRFDCISFKNGANAAVNKSDEIARLAVHFKEKLTDNRKDFQCQLRESVEDYIKWCKENKIGSWQPRLTHIFHGKSGPQRAERLLTKLKQLKDKKEITGQDIYDLFHEINKVVKDSGNKQHSLARYLLDVIDKEKEIYFNGGLQAETLGSHLMVNKNYHENKNCSDRNFEDAKRNFLK